MRDIILHGHIFKNAGTTLDWSLARSFDADFIDHRQDKLMRNEPAVTLGKVLEGGAQVRAISSHSMPCPAPGIDGVRFHLLLMLRHPLRRIRSVYDFERRQDAQTPGAVAAKEKNYEDYVAWRMHENVGPTIRNFQTRFLAGVRTRQRGVQVDLAQFNRAVEVLSGTPCPGIVERYDESMVVFEHALAKEFPDLDLAYVPQNVSRSRFGRRRSRSWYTALGGSHDAAITGNAFDLTLYELANRQLDAAIDAIGDFPARLDDFRRRCAALR